MRLACARFFIFPSLLSLNLGCSGGEAGNPVATGGADARTMGGQAPNGGGGASGGGAPLNSSGGASAGTGGQITSGGTSGGGSAGAAASGAAGTAGATSVDTDPKPPRPIDVQPGEAVSLNYNGQPMFVNKSKPIQGKLVLLLGGICTGTGAGGFEAFVKQYGFHVFAPKTDTCVTSAPDKYKDIIETTPNDPEANRQVADARMELWDGKDRVDWVSRAPGESIVEQTIGAIEFGDAQDPGADWGYFLNADGSLRTTDVYVVGYSWGSQSWAMISAYVRFGRVIATSGPVSEGFPDAAWITQPSPNATPSDRKYLLVGLKSPYPSADAGDKGDMEKFSVVMKAGWSGTPTNVMPGDAGPYVPAQHLFAMIGSNGTSPGGHTVFCNDNPSNGWLPLCKHALGVE